MAIVQTLSTRKFTTARVGNVEVQPVTRAPEYAARQETRRTYAPSSQAPLPSDSPIATLVGMVRDENHQLTRVTNPSIATLVEMVPNPQFTLPGLSSNVNTILPSYFSHLQPRVVHRADSADDFGVSTREFEPYEKLTGISHERPEIIMLTPFLPLYADGSMHSQPPFIDLVEGSGVKPYMTDAGWYADTQLHIRNLRAVDAAADLKRLKKKNASLRDQYKRRKEEFEKQINSLNDITQFLLNLVKKSDKLKGQLDLRDDLFKVDPQKQAEHLASSFPNGSNVQDLISLLTGFVKKFLPPAYTLPEALIRLGYPQAQSKSLYASSKIWLQLLLEYKQIIQNHSLEFIDIERVVQKNDKSASTLIRPDTHVFGLATNDPVRIGPVSDMIKAQPRDLNLLLAALRNAFRSIYDKGAHFKSEEARISGLANLLSKEHKFSQGLSEASVRKSLADFYGYTTKNASDGNLQLFDFVIGRFGQNVFDMPSAERNSLASLAHQKLPNNNGALATFESKYLDGDNGTLTPGAVYYVDPIFQTAGQSFDTARLSSLGLLLKDSHKNFSSIVSGMNLLSVANVDPKHRRKNDVGTYINNPSELIKYILAQVLDKQGNTLSKVRSDRLSCIYVFASGNSAMKSALFLYTLNKMFRANFLIPGFDNTATTDSLIGRILATLSNNTQESRTTGLQLSRSQGRLVDANDLDEDALKTALKQGTELTKTVESLMLQIFDAVKQTTSNNRMRYSGQFDTVIMMVSFDMLISIMGKYANQRIVSRRLSGRAGSRKTTYLVSKTFANHKHSVNDIVTRLDRELMLTHKLTYCFLNVLQKLSNSITGFINFVNSPASVTNLKALSTTIGDPGLLQMLMSEQQIMLLGSTVADLKAKFNNAMVVNPSVDIDRDGDFDSDDEIKILDDSIITPRLRDALFGLFKTKQFVGARAYNKRILTVGIPLGFTRRLKQKVSQEELNKTSFVAKQHDIVQVVVYKVDLLNQDVIYKPKRFMFEMSRFSVRNDAPYKALSTNPTFDEIVDSIPTRDFEESFEENAGAVEYWSSRNERLNNKRNAMSSDSYDFLKIEQKAEIAGNHITSQLLEVYIKLMAGISVAEYEFDLIERPRSIEPEFVKLLTEHRLQEAADFLNVRTRSFASADNPQDPNEHPPVGGMLFASTLRRSLPQVSSNVARHSTQAKPKTTSASGIAGRINIVAHSHTIENPPDVQATRVPPRPQIGARAALNSLSHRQIPEIVHSLRSTVKISKTHTSISNALAVSRQILSPKQFDRVFNVVVDPDEFEIDFYKTTKTKFGTKALEQMIKRGDVVSASETASERSIKKNLPLQAQLQRVLSRPVYKGRPDPNINNFKFRDRNRTEGDMMFEKYFVTIETFGEEDV